MSFFRDRKAQPEAPAIHQAEGPVALAQEAPLPDKAGCLARLDAELADERNRGAALKLYLEGFKTLNDTFGYDFGERLLAQISEYLRSQPGCTVYRYIGVEFVVVLERGAYGQAAELADRIGERFSQVWTINGTDCLCSVHIGIATYPGAARNGDEFIKMLDQAVSESVDVGPNTYVVYDSQFHTKVQRRHKIAGALQEAVRGDLFEFYYNPVFSRSKGCFARAESSIRLFVPGVGPVSASEFIPLAEDSGQVVEFQYYAIEKVCAFIRELTDQGIPFESVALPVSAVLFFQMDMIDKVGDLLDRYQVPVKKLAFKVNESVLTTAYLNANIAMQELSDLGVELILSNFGTGYSGISSILDLPVDVVKLERMFIWQLEISERSGCLIEGLIGIANKLGLKIIAEGVETETQLQKLAQYQCDYEQGFFYSPRVSKERLMQMLGRSLEESREMAQMAEK